MTTEQPCLELVEPATVKVKLPAKTRFHNHNANTFVCLARHCVACGCYLLNYEMKALNVHYYENHNLRKRHVLCSCHKTLLDAYTCVFR